MGSERAAKTLRKLAVKVAIKEHRVPDPVELKRIEQNALAATLPRLQQMFAEMNEILEFDRKVNGVTPAQVHLIRSLERRVYGRGQSNLLSLDTYTFDDASTYITELRAALRAQTVTE